MKPWIALACLVTISAGVVLGWRWNGQDSGQPTGTKSDSSAVPVLSVDELVQNFKQHPGIVRVEGVVSAASPKSQKLALIDSEEFRQCGVTTCARFTLPVRWTRTMPSLKDTVRVEGEVQRLEGKLIFVARLLERIEPPQRGSK